jgi:hypothetical protein
MIIFRFVSHGVEGITCCLLFIKLISWAMSIISEVGSASVIKCKEWEKILSGFMGYDIA